MIRCNGKLVILSGSIGFVSVASFNTAAAAAESISSSDIASIGVESARVKEGALISEGASSATDGIVSLAFAMGALSSVTASWRVSGSAGGDLGRCWRELQDANPDGNKDHSGGRHAEHGRPIGFG